MVNTNTVCAHQIEENLFLGNFSAMASTEFMIKNKIKIVLSVIDIDIPNEHKIESIEYHRVVAQDCEAQDLLTYFEDTYRIIALAQFAKRAVLVHCMAGISRSATIVIAYIMAKRHMGYKDALNFVSIERTFISPNNAFERQLTLYGDMNFMLDPNYKPFRRYLLENILFSDILSDSIEEYYKKKHIIDERRKLYIRQQYLCSKDECNYTLFSDLHLIYSKTQKCNNLFIEPQEWMKNILIYGTNTETKKYCDGTIKCPKCKQVVAHYRKNFQSYNCDHLNCLSHENLSCLYIKVNKKAVEQVAI